MNFLKLYYSVLARSLYSGKPPGFPNINLVYATQNRNVFLNVKSIGEQHIKVWQFHFNFFFFFRFLNKTKVKKKLHVAIAS